MKQMLSVGFKEGNEFTERRTQEVIPEQDFLNLFEGQSFSYTAPKTCVKSIHLNLYIIKSAACMAYHQYLSGKMDRFR